MAEQRIDSYREASFDELNRDISSFINASGEFSQNVKNASSIFNQALDSMNKNLAFVSKELQSTFKQYSSVEGKKQKFMFEFYQQQADAGEIVEKLRKAVDAAEKAGNTEQANALKQQKNIAEQYYAQIKSIDASTAYAREAQDKLTAYRKKVLTKAVDDFVGIFQRTMSSAWDTLNASYNNNYKTITSLGAYDKSKYNDILNYFDDFIRKAGLEKSVNRTDFENTIAQILSGGLGGNTDLAKLVTKYSVIAKEGGVNIDFTDQSFLMMIKNMSDAGQDVESFLEMVTVESKAVMSQVGDSFGFANGQINTMVATLSELQSVTHMTDRALQSSATSMTALNGVLGSTGIDPNKLYKNIIDYSNNGLIGASADSLLAFSGMNSSQMKNLLETQGMGAALDLMMKNIYSRYKTSGATGELTAALSSALGSDLTTADLNKLFKKYNTYESFSSAFTSAKSAASSADIDSYMSSLQNFQTNQEKLDNQAVNALSDINQTTHENLATEYTLNSILRAITSGSIITGITSAINLGRDVKQASGGKFSLTKFNNGYFKTGLGQLEILKKGGLNSSNVKDVAAAGRNSLTGVSKSSAALGILSGLVTQGSSAVDAYKIAKQNGTNVTASTALGFLTGYTDYGMANEQKLASVKDKGLIDLGQLFKTAAAGAVIGSGAGTFAGGPAGTLIGGLVGGLVGMGANATAQIANKIDYKQYLKSDIGSLGDSLQRTHEGLSKLSSTFSDYQSLLSKNNELQKLKTTQTKEEQALTELQIKANEKLIEQKLAELGATKDLVAQFERNAATISQGRAVISAMASISQKMNSAGITSSTDVTKLSVEDINALVSDEELEAFRKNGYIKSTGNNIKDKIGIVQSISGSTKGRNWFSKIETDRFSMSSAQGGVNSSFYTDLVANTSSAEASNAENRKIALQLISGYDSTDPSTYTFLQKGLAILLNDAKIRFGGSEGLNSVIDGQSIGKVIGLLSENNDYANLDYSGYQSWLNTNAIASGEFKGLYRTGLAYVPYDNFPAILHKGERVLNASDAANYSTKSGMSSTLANALVSQVDNIVTILNNIYTYMQTGTTPASQSAIYNQPINYNLPAGV